MIIYRIKILHNIRSCNSSKLSYLAGNSTNFLFQWKTRFIKSVLKQARNLYLCTKNNEAALYYALLTCSERILLEEGDLSALHESSLRQEAWALPISVKVTPF